MFIQISYTHHDRSVDGFPQKESHTQRECPVSLQKNRTKIGVKNRTKNSVFLRTKYTMTTIYTTRAVYTLHIQITRVNHIIAELNNKD